ncbi:MAG: VWA domain-containing protein [Haloferacaceae archaeon]
MSDPTGDGGERGPLGEELVRFVRSLRRAGASVPANAASTAARALAEVGLRDRDRVRTALRASLLTDADDFETFDGLFEAFWSQLVTGLGEGESAAPDDGEQGGSLAPLDAQQTGADTTERAGDGVGDAEADRSTVRSVAREASELDAGESTTTARYSPTGSQRDVDGPLPPATDDLSAATRSLTRTLAGLQGRHFEAGTGRADVRRALRTSVSSGGAVLSLPERERRRTATRALLFVDVSRSVLDTVDRGFLIDFLRQVSGEWRDARVFLFDEDAREVTDAVDTRSAADALDALEAAEATWGGGTRIGASLRTLHRTAADAVDRRTVVFVVSDGLEMGDVDVLERELSWVARRAKRLLWLNPLAAGEAYEPTARGMAAALPYLDGLFAFAGPDDVAELARQLRQYGLGGRVGYEFDARGTHEAHRRTTTRQTEP